MTNQGWSGQGGYPGRAGGFPSGYAHYPAGPPQAPMGAQRCQACQRPAPTKQVTLMQNVGVIVLRFPKTIRGALCKRCIDHHFWKMTTITFFFGWWGVISFFYSLVSIPANITTYLGSRSLRDGY